MMTLVIAFQTFCLLLNAAPEASPLERAWQLVAQGKRDEAVQVLNKVVKSEPRNADAKLLLGSILMEKRDRSSLSLLAEAVRLRPSSADAHNALGEAYSAFGEFSSAKSSLERAVTLSPSFAEARTTLGSVLLQLGETDAAARQLDRAIALFGNRPHADYPHYLRAKIYQESRDPERAAAELEKSVALNANFAEAWSDLGEARKQLLQDVAALNGFQRSVEVNPDNPIGQTRLGSALVDAGRTSEAVKHLRRAVTLGPSESDGAECASDCVTKVGQSGRSRSDQASALRLAPSERQIRPEAGCRNRPQ